MKKKLIFCCFVSLALKGVHLVPRISPWGGNMRDPGNELNCEPSSYSAVYLQKKQDGERRSAG